MNAPFPHSVIGFAVLLLTNEEAANRVRHMERFDAFHALMEQLGKNSALGGLMLAQRYHPRNYTKG